MDRTSSITSTALLVVDIQEKLIPTIAQSLSVISRSKFMIEVAKILEMPVFISEQYPKGLGSTINELGEIMSAPVLSKTAFSAGSVPELLTGLNEREVETVILIGIEAHVCVLQTALDLKRREFRVVVACDAVSSRSEFDRDIAFRRLASAGVVLSTTEAITFELLKDSKHPAFKAISQLIKDFGPTRTS